MNTVVGIRLRRTNSEREFRRDLSARLSTSMFSALAGLFFGVGQKTGDGYVQYALRSRTSPKSELKSPLLYSH